MQSPLELGAVVLCGGKSRRMGRHKAWLPFGPDEVLLQRVVRLLSQAVDSVVVVAAANEKLPLLPEKVLVVTDPVADQGPLRGLWGGFTTLPGSIRWIYATATDVPFLEPRWISLLSDRIGEYDAAIPFLMGRHHPLAGLYRRETCLPVVHSLLDAGNFRLMELARSVRTVFLNEDAFQDIDPGLRTVENLNTPEDYRQALLRVGLSSDPLI